MVLRDLASIEIIPTLGRPLQLGMLYDCTKDLLIPGVTLWDMETIQKDVHVSMMPKTEFKVLTSDCIEDKASALNVSTSLKASFLGGLIEVSGAAKYFTEMKASKNHARVTLQYSTTTRFEQLTMKHLGPQNISYPGLFDQQLATHVVSAVMYGAQAFFVFDREVASSESMQDAHGELHSMTKKIPMVEMAGKGAVTMTRSEKAKGEKLGCTFYGDFSLENNPSTYEEAINIYKTLPSLLGTKAQNAVPVKVWLYPLGKLDSRAAQSVYSISEALVADVQATIEEMNDIDMECIDLMNHPAAKHFPKMKRTIQKFQNMCKQYKLTFQGDIARVVPLIRGGAEEEGAMVDILTSKDQSPFQSQRLAEFLKLKNREMNLVSSYLDVLKESKSIRLITTETELNQVVLDQKVERVIAYTFTSLGEEEPYILELKSWLHLQYMNTTYPPNSADRECVKKMPIEWFSDTNIIQKMKKYVKTFLKFANENILNRKIQFVVACVPDFNYPGASIYLYEEGVIISREFEPPQMDPPLISKISHDCVQLTCTPFPNRSDEILGYRVEYRHMSEENWMVVEQNHPLEVIAVRGLHPNSVYQFRQSALCAKWVTLPSDSTDRIKTLPASPPVNLVGLEAKPNAIILNWKESIITGAGIRISDYKIEYRKEAGDESKWVEQRAGKKKESWTIEGLMIDTSYRFRVSAICGNAGSSAPSEDYAFSSTMEWKKACRYADPQILDPDTAHPRLVLSEDRRSVRWGESWQDLPDTSERYDLSECVLGLESIASGKHYWEVEVGDGRFWHLGICDESTSRKGMLTLTPERGYWAVGLRDRLIRHLFKSMGLGGSFGYEAFTSPTATRISRSRHIRVVGVFLNYEAGKVSFYNAEEGSLLFAFPPCCFPHSLRPYFYTYSIDPPLQLLQGMAQ